MKNENREKIAKIYELVQRGATDGEKKAAEIALNKLIKKFNISDEYLEKIKLKKYEFKYSTILDLKLFMQLHSYFFKGKDFKAERRTIGTKSIICSFEYLDYIVIMTAYEYFKRHMNKEFKKVCVPLINKCRSTKTKNKRRQELQGKFFSRYVIKSKIYHQEELTSLDYSKLSKKEIEDIERLMKIEGGNYHTQLNTGLFLN